MPGFSDYLPVSPNIIRTGTKVGCDLYIAVKRTAGIKFVLYCKGDVDFEEIKRLMLKVENIRSFYIKKDKQGKFFEYTHYEVVLGISWQEIAWNFDFSIEQNQRLSNAKSRIL